MGKVLVLAGACHDTTADAGARTAVTASGAAAADTVAKGEGLTSSEAADASELPTEFAAVTLKVYAESSVSPETVQ
jgi:hypothetical protein